VLVRFTCVTCKTNVAAYTDKPLFKAKLCIECFIKVNVEVERERNKAALL